VAHFAEGGDDAQGALLVHGHVVGAGNLHLDVRRVAARHHDEVVSRSPLILIVPHRDAVVDRARERLGVGLNAHRVLRGGAYVKVLAQLRGLHTKAGRFGGCPVEVDAHDMTVTNGVRTRPLGLVQVEHNAGVGYPVIQSRLRCHKASPRIPLPTVLGEDLTALFEQGLLRLRGRRRGDDLLLRERRAGPQRHQSDERSHHHLQIHDHGRNSSLSGRSRNSRHAR
jgi:hypothetical protein